MAGAQWFTADTHFDHTLVAQLRGYETPQQHDEAIVAAWNKQVRPTDTVWHLGDVGIGSLKRSAPWLEQLNGTIHLITGNHDQVAPGVHRNAHRHQRAWLEHFETIAPFARIRINKQNILLSHYPYSGEGKRDLPERYSQFRLKNEGLPLIHGHTHANTKLTQANETPQIHVGWDAWRRPVNLGEIRDLLTEHYENHTLIKLVRHRLQNETGTRTTLEDLAKQAGINPHTL